MDDIQPSDHRGHGTFAIANRGHKGLYRVLALEEVQWWHVRASDITPRLEFPRSRQGQLTDFHGYLGPEEVGHRGL